MKNILSIRRSNFDTNAPKTALRREMRRETSKRSFDWVKDRRLWCWIAQSDQLEWRVWRAIYKQTQSARTNSSPLFFESFFLSSVFEFVLGFFWNSSISILDCYLLIVATFLQTITAYCIVLLIIRRFKIQMT